jgi:NAD(P)H dehydrogenase (quinone)
MRGTSRCVSLLLANPKPSSLCHALASAGAEACRSLGCEVHAHDLYQEGFKPLLEPEELLQRRSEDPLVEQHCREAAAADAFIVVHPNWWGQPPAILKGWVDRVLRPGVAYRFDADDSGAGVPTGLLKARIAIVLNTSDTPMERERSIFGDPLDTLWGRCIFPYCGVPGFFRHAYGVVVNSRPEERAAWIEHARDAVSAKLSEAFAGARS